MKTKFYKIVTLLLMLSCKEHQDIEVYNVEVDEGKKEILVEIRNNTENNYYLLSPTASIMAKDLQHISGEMIEGQIHHEKLDSIVCTAYIWDETCNNKEFENYHRPIVLLPKKSIKKLNINIIMKKIIK